MIILKHISTVVQYCVNMGIIRGMYLFCRQQADALVEMSFH